MCADLEQVLPKAILQCKWAQKELAVCTIHLYFTIYTGFSNILICMLCEPLQKVLCK